MILIGSETVFELRQIMCELNRHLELVELEHDTERTQNRAGL